MHIYATQGKKLSLDSKNIATFKGKEIRKTIHNNEWWFSVVDVVAALADSTNPHLRNAKGR